jgi:hypothetical protein
MIGVFSRGAEIVGVVGDVRYGPMDRPSQPDAYLPYMQFSPRTMILFGRTAGDPVALVEAVRRHVGKLDRTLPIYDIKTMRQRINDATVNTRFNVILLTAFAVVAIVLAVVGIYGVMSFAVWQRTTGNREGALLSPSEARGGELRRLQRSTLTGS